MKITHISDQCAKLVEESEGLQTKAYKCPAGVWTIGLGTTHYPDGRAVQPGDVCTREQAYGFFHHDIAEAERNVDALTVDTIDQSEFDALCDFVYNCGVGNYQTSTLRKMVNANPKAPAIAAEFAKWNKGNGKVLLGLVKRRDKESKLYFA